MDCPELGFTGCARGAAVSPGVGVAGSALRTSWATPSVAWLINPTHTNSAANRPKFTTYILSPFPATHWPRPHPAMFQQSNRQSVGYRIGSPASLFGFARGEGHVPDVRLPADI